MSKKSFNGKVAIFHYIVYVSNYNVSKKLSIFTFYSGVRFAVYLSIENKIPTTEFLNPLVV